MRRAASDTAAPLPLAVGDEVCVHGQGFGRITEIIERDRRNGGSYALVAIPRRDYHEPSRRNVIWTETRAVDLDVYPPHLSRSAR